MKKMNVTLSLPTDTNAKLAEFAKENGLTKSALVTLLVSKLEKKDGNIFL